MVTARHVLSYLARLAPRPGQQQTTQHWNVVTNSDDIGWYPAAGVWASDLPARNMQASPNVVRLASIDALQTERLLRVGWMWVVGRTHLVHDGERASRSTGLCLPVLTRTVSFSGSGPKLDFEWHSDVEVHPNFAQIPGFVELIEPHIDEFVRGRAPSGEALQQIHTALGLVGVVEPVESDPKTNPYHYRLSAHNQLSRGVGVYMDRSVKPPTAARQLQRWASVDVSGTAFAQLYDLADGSPESEVPHHRTSPLPLNAKQRHAIERIGQEPVVTIAGPPGTGKSHAAVAVACEAIHRGRSVLIATKSDHAAQSLCELLDRYETPAYVRFGNDDHRRSAVERLTKQQAAFDRQQRQAIEEAAASAQTERDRRFERITTTLHREERFRRAQRLRAKNAGATAAAPGAFEPSANIGELQELLDDVRSPGWWDGLWRRRRERALRAAVRARADASLDDIALAIALAQADHEMHDALKNETVQFGHDWAALEEAEAGLTAATAAALVARQSDALSRRERKDSGAAAAALGGVLRAGKKYRAEMLAQALDDSFLQQAPLWVGTLDEIESTLPARPGLFDLVIFDEASQIDQLAATPALCRAERVVVVGDPKQLRHVSFVSDAESDAAREAESIPAGSLSQLLDVRRNSLFDVAAGAAPTTQLDEHFRSVPHLIDFSNQRFYNDELRLMTQHPRVEGVDAIWHGRVDGRRGDDGVVDAEIETIISHLGHMIDSGDHRSVGVVTPFRAQADALLAAAARSLPLGAIRTLDLRIGTVHGMQGTERDLIMVSLGLGDDDLGRSLRFVQDPNLFNVMVTRARGQIAVYHSFDPGNLPAGLLRDWFLTGDLPPGGISGEHARDPWTAQLAQELAATGLRVVADYPVAGWTVDLAVGEGDWAFGVETGLHPDGVDAHVERHLTLRRAGWHLVDAFESRWLLRSGEAVAQLATLAEQRRHGADAAS